MSVQWEWCSAGRSSNTGDRGGWLTVENKFILFASIIAINSVATGGE